MTWVVAVAVLAGCRVEGGRSAAPPAADSAASRQPMAHGVFDRRREEVAPGVVRLTVSAIVSMRNGQDSAQATIERLLAAERGLDSAVAAIRLLAYFPPNTGHGQAAGQSPLVPLAFADWAPLTGWNSLTVETAGGPHSVTTTFMHDAATMRSLGIDPGERTMPPAQTPPGGVMPPARVPPGATMPPGHPAPRTPR